MSGIVKREFINTRSGRNMPPAPPPSATEAAAGRSNCSNDDDSGGGDVFQRRRLRSRYTLVKNRISDERNDISKVDIDKFKEIIEQVDSLHQHVQKPREQIVDAEALLDITNTLVTSVKAHTSEGMTPSDLINCLLGDFGAHVGPSSSLDQTSNSVRWKDIGSAVSHVFRTAPGFSTMVGPMDTGLKPRKPIVHRKRARPEQSARPEELDKSAAEEKTDTDKNMAVMFNILRQNRRVRLENLILNRNSFAQTVENLFALSFLVKDGRAEISVDGNGIHFVVPRNAPAANTVLSGEVSYVHFVFRFDFKDWKLMLASVEAGEELMLHRTEVKNTNNSQPVSAQEETEAQLPTTPIRKLTRNRGRVLQEQIVAESSPENDDDQARRAAAIRKGKQKVR